MECAQVKQMISRYVDQNLDPQEKRTLEHHLRACPGCQEAIEGQMAVHQLLGSAEKFEAPLGFATRVMARLEERERRPSFWSFFTLQPAFLRVAEVAFALVIVFIGMVSGNLLVTSKLPERSVTVQETFSLDLFQATPPDSIGGIYVTLAGGKR